MSSKKISKPVIGRLEKVGFPDWQLFDIDAKIDTGAFTSSLHCHHIELNAGHKHVSFNILDPTHPEFEDRIFTCEVSDIRSIKSSNGISEERIVISTVLELAGKKYALELSLTDRSEMRHPVLLGRRFLKNKFIIDVAKKYTGSGE